MDTPTDQSLRLFIAVDLSTAVRAALHDVQMRLQRQQLSVRWVDPGGAHVTLKYLGMTNGEQIQAITARLHEIAERHRAFTLQTGALGAFPGMARPRVVWLGIDGDRAALTRLRDDVEHTIAPLGFPTEDRPFSPHLTLGRTNPTITPLDRIAVGRVLAQQTAPPPVTFVVDQIVVFRSDLGPGGARYTPMVQAKLRTEA